MEDLFVEPGDLTPGVKLNAGIGELCFYGRMMPIDTYGFFNPILDWVKEYIEQPRDSTIIRVKVDAINTSSAKTIVVIFNLLCKLKDKGKEVAAEWYYEDEEDVDDWRDYLSSFNMPIEYIQDKNLGLG